MILQLFQKIYSKNPTVAKFFDLLTPSRSLDSLAALLHGDVSDPDLDHYKRHTLKFMLF